MDGESVNAEVLALAYGAVVRQLLADLNDVESVNAQLKRMGNNIGMRIVEEFLAKTEIDRCSNFQQTSKTVAERAFPMFLGVRGTARAVDNGERESIITLKELPLAEFVEIPPHYQGLQYCNMVAGVVEGALARVNMNVKCDIIKDVLTGAQEYEFMVKLLQEVPAEQYPFGEND